MSDNTATYNGGIGFTGLLGILFIGLKLGHVIDWAWLWVLSPLWLPLVVVTGGFLVFLLAVLVIGFFKG